MIAIQLPSPVGMSIEKAPSGSMVPVLICAISVAKIPDDDTGIATARSVRETSAEAEAETVPALTCEPRRPGTSIVESVGESGAGVASCVSMATAS
jgi:hypothetical protein